MVDIKQIFAGKQRGASSIIYNTDDIDFSPFAFVLNVKQLVDTDHIEIAPGYTLRQARESETEYIKEFLLGKFGEIASMGVWESRPTSSGKQQNLPKSDWRYFVVEFGNDDPDLDLLESALTLARSGIDIGFAKIRVDIQGLVRPACLYRTPSLFQSLLALNLAGAEREKLMQSLGAVDGQEISGTIKRMARHDHAVLDLSRVVSLLIEIKDLPRFSPLQVLGYFAILESVLTHHPDPNDRYKSTTRQITHKLALLNRRWSPALDYSQFGGASHEKIWTKMYAYRSSIAHGRKPDFASPLALLKSADAANELIGSAVRRTISQAYMEPQLIADLHSV
jgi:hypothetical protein